VFSTVIPSKIFEAMAMGVPIIMSLPEGEATGIIHETGSGVCVNPERPHELSEVIVRMASGEIDCHNLSMAGQRAAKNFSRDEAASRMLSAMERIADSSMERT
jgi:glycosyltransferase involved in cell wall biosynthesis